MKIDKHIFTNTGQNFNYLFICCILLGQNQQNGSHSKIACHGEAVTLQCLNGEQIHIKDAIYKQLDSTVASLCRHVNKNATSVSCRGQPLRERISTLCKGKDVCQLSENIANSVQNECKTSFYLRVSYDCGIYIQYFFFTFYNFSYIVSLIN